jgi:DNA-binding NarL/FixJ family response regulator
VARYCARGWRYDRIAVELRVSPRTVEHYVRSIADLLTWDDDVSPQLRVALWAQSALMAWSSPPPHHIGDSSGVSTDDAAA